ncbi:cysteine-rich tail protein 1 [Tursiops truncatus]|uniref:Cysteine-rich tail protein 1 n=1 Tax=Tursiops truncatus TaxID=9739 RepID=A0A2U3V518_TURTR|nr:cysteine-rich tail protein 1 [Tursiops truncatus]
MSRGGQAAVNAHPKKERWVAAVLQEPGPPGILGTPSLSPAHSPAPPQEGKGSCQSLSSQAPGPGPESSRAPAQRTRQLAAATTSGQAMDPPEMLVKDPYAHVSIPRAHLRPELGQQLDAAPSSLESQPLPVGSCTLEPTEEAPGPKGAKGPASIQGQQAWQQPCTPYGSGQGQAGLTYAGLPPMGCGGNTAHHCWCCVIS